MNVGLADLLNGKIPSQLLKSSTLDFGYYDSKSSTEKYSQMFVNLGLHKFERINNEEIERAKVIMEDLLDKEPIPFTEVCKIVRMKHGVLKQKLPVLCLQLKTRFRASKKERRIL